MKQNVRKEGAAVVCTDPSATADWFCRYLFFKRNEDTFHGTVCIENGNCVLYLMQSGDGRKDEENSERAGEYLCGLEHIALHTEDIQAAAAYLRGQGLELDITGDEFRFSPQVFGNGEWYFHVCNPFHLVIEISQKIGMEQPQAGEADGGVISGLDHYGIPCVDAAEEISFFQQQGFTELFPPVENHSAEDGRIRCVMLGRNGITLEIYELTEKTGILRKGENNFLILDGPGNVSPSGVRLESAAGYDITALGECLVDILCREENGVLKMEGNPGGAPANVLAIASRLGENTCMITKVGNDDMGRFLKKHIHNAGIGLSSFIMDDYPTTLAMVKLDETGNRSFSFYRDRTADVMLSEKDLSEFVLKNTKIMHFGSLSLTVEPCRTATLSAIQLAKESGAIISYDPNLRPNLWPSLSEAKDRILSVMKYADLVKVSDEELVFLTGVEDIHRAMELLYDEYPMKYLVVTRGEHGALMKNDTGFYSVLAYDTGCVDTTGAGDAFWGAFLTGFLMNDGDIKLKQGSFFAMDEAEQLLQFSCAAGSLATSRYGAIPAMPDMEEIEWCMKEAKTL